MSIDPTPEVSVVVPHYRDPRRLALVLRGLELQDLDMPFEVIVADDGSPTLPQPGPRPFPVRVVSHSDLGNRTGPARNLGARAARGETLVFIDGDTVPEPSFLREITAVCDGRHLTVGRRRHADLSAATPDQLEPWFAGRDPGPPQLPEPAWLADGYRELDDLRLADARSYRFIISAVLACPKALFLQVGGFAEELVGYGGEDWEFARRCWLAGADLRHAPGAVGWHDGPDLAGRPDDLIAVKNAETLRIARLLTDPALRGRGLIWDHPRVVVRFGPLAKASVGAWVACAEGLLQAGDVGIWTGDGLPLPVPDPRIKAGMPGTAVLGRAELIVDLRSPAAITPELLDQWQATGPVRAGADLLAASPRDLALGTIPTDTDAPPPIGSDTQLESWFGTAQNLLIVRKDSSASSDKRCLNQLCCLDLQAGVIMQAIEAEREALDRLPSILSDLLNESGPAVLRAEGPDRGIDAVVDVAGTRWWFEIKASAGPGVVARVAEHFESLRDRIAGIAVLVVPHMSAGGARIASERSLNWIDLSGNAQLRSEQLYISVRGRPNQFAAPGRPASPFAPKSSRVARALLRHPERWWRQKDLAEQTDLDPGRISRVVSALSAQDLLSRDGALLRPRDPDVLLAAWAEDYRYERHDIVSGHLSGAGSDLSALVNDRLTRQWSGHAFTGLPAAWLLDGFARFRLVSVYVDGDPREAAAAIGMRRGERGANVQLIGPDDRGVFDGGVVVDDCPCVSVPQILLDLRHLPERAAEAAEHLRTAGPWP